MSGESKIKWPEGRNGRRKEEGTKRSDTKEKGAKDVSTFLCILVAENGISHAILPLHISHSIPTRG